MRQNWCQIEQIPLNSKEELEEVLNIIKEQCINVYYRKRDWYEDIKQDAFIHETEFKIRITFKPGLKAKTYIFDKDGDYLIKTTPLQAIAAMSRAYKVQRCEDIGMSEEDIEMLGSAIPLLYKNEKYNGIPTYAYEYDLKEAYAQMLRKPLPNLYSIKYDAIVGDNQVGFYRYEQDLRCTFKKGMECEFVFDLMPSPYIKWLDRLEKKVELAKTAEEKLEIKSLYRFAIGCLQHINPFWRSIIVHRCNQLVESLKDEYTIYCNTDSLVSEKRRFDIESSTEYKWALKREYELFKWQKDKLNYQWNTEVPHYKGIYKRYIRYYNKTHDRNWDILTDPFPTEVKHKFTLDRRSLTIHENKDDWDIQSN